MWWKQFPKTESRWPKGPSAGDRPDPGLVMGVSVRLRGRPEKLRRVLGLEWHWHRQEYVYLVETSARAPFAPYWFAAQLEVVEGETFD